MGYVVTGLPLQPFRPLFALDDAALQARGVVRMQVDAKPGFPCRVTLEDAEPGGTVLLLPWRHHDVDTPYRADGPIFVSESARATGVSRNAVPDQQRSRLLSVRAYDAAGWMREAEVVEGDMLESLIASYFEDQGIDYLHVHNARRGCYACRIDRD
jgi:hypothetical protein